MCVDIRERERLDLADGIAADVMHHVVGDIGIEHAHDPLKQCSERDQHTRADEQRKNRRKVDAAALHAEVDRVADEDRHIERHADDGKREKQSQENFAEAAADIRKHAAKRLLVSHLRHLLS